MIFLTTKSNVSIEAVIYDRQCSQADVECPVFFPKNGHDSPVQIETVIYDRLQKACRMCRFSIQNPKKNSEKVPPSLSLQAQ